MTSSTSSSGLFRQRNGSGILSQPSTGFFDRLRRPRTATATSSSGAPREGQLGQATDYSLTRTEEMADGGGGGQATNSPSRSVGGGGRLSFSSRNGLPHSSSSSQVHLPGSGVDGSPGGGQRNENGGTRRPGLSNHHSSQSHSNIRFNKSLGSGNGGGMTSSSSTSSTGGSNLGFPLLSRTGSSQGAGGPPTSGGFSRMFRRYSQGAGRNTSAPNEAHAIAAATPSSNSAAHSSVEAAPDSSADNSLRLSSGDGVSRPGSAPAADAIGLTPSATTNNVSAPSNSNSGMTTSEAAHTQTHSAHRIRLVPHLEATRSLHFEPIERDLVEGSMAVKIGRFTDRGQASAAAGATEGSVFGGTSTVAGSGFPASASGGSVTNTTTSSGMPGARGGAIPSATGGAGRVDTGRIAFKSKVVSRGHAEIWCEAGGKVFLRDTKSSSGTFLNHIRLSAPNIESKPFQIKDGDVVQLGVDYQGGTEEIYRCVKMRVELNRGWQRGANQFNVNALRQLRALQGSPLPDPVTVATSKAKSDAALPTNRQSLNVTDCCICLFSVTVCQALFIAPCSHVFHYKCIRPLLNLHHPGFSCPLCRTFADLEADVEEDEAWQQALLKEAGAGTRAAEIDAAHADASTPMNEEPLPSLVAVAIASSTSSEAEHFVDAAAYSAAPQFLNANDQTVVLAPSAQGRSHDSSAYSSDGRRGSSAEESLSGSRDSRRIRSPSRRSGSSHRDSPLRESSSAAARRPDTAVSSSTAVPFGAINGHLDSPASRRTSRSAGRGATPAAEDDTQEMLYDERSAAAMYEHGRRPSGPIDISNTSSSGGGTAANPAHHARHLADGFTSSPTLSDSRTPQNEHFLSTLAEAPPPSRSALRPS